MTRAAMEAFYGKQHDPRYAVNTWVPSPEEEVLEIEEEVVYELLRQLGANDAATHRRRRVGRHVEKWRRAYHIQAGRLL